MKNLQKWITLAAASLLLCGCKRSDPEAASAPIAVQPEITRVSDLDFDTGDRIGLTVRTDTGDYLANVPLTYNGSLFTGDAVWYADAARTATLLACYPYQAAGMPASFSVAADQTTGCSASDLLLARREGVTPSVMAVNMTFTHMLVKLLVEVTNTSGSAVTGLVIGGSIPTATVDVAAKSVAVQPTAAAADIKAFAAEAGRSYQAILVPQQAALSLTVTTADGKSRTVRTAAADMRSGYSYTVQLTVTAESIAMRLSGAVDAWISGGALTPGDATETGDSGSSSILTYKGEQYAIGLQSDGRTWMLENLRCTPDNKTVSADASAEAGVWYPCTTALAASTDSGYVREKGLLYDFSTAMAGASAAGSQGICPSGWHIPTQAEIEAWIAAASTADKQGFLPYGGLRNGSSAAYSAQLTGGQFRRGNIWSSTGSGSAATALLTEGESARTTQQDTNYGLPVRCVKDE